MDERKKLDKGVLFGKSKKWISDLGSMDSSASKKRKIRNRIIFHDNANKQTQSCVQILKTRKKQG